MSKQSRILTGTVIALLVIGAGVAFGYYIYTHKNAASSVPKIAAAEKPEPNFNTYEISPPSRATTIETREVEINPADDKASVTIPKQQAGDIKTGQRVLLYGENGVLIDTLGEVTAIKEGVEELAGSIVVEMKLNSDDKVDAGAAKVAKIITKRLPNSARLPLNALVRNEKDEPYVWEAVENADGTTTAYYKRANVAATTYEYFVIVPEIHQSGIFILNPDKKLRDGEKINISRINYTPPPYTEESRVFQKMERRRHIRERNRFTIAEIEQKLADAKKAEAQKRASGTRRACPSPPNITKKFIESIKRTSPPHGPQSLPLNAPSAQ